MVWVAAGRVLTGKSTLEIPTCFIRKRTQDQCRVKIDAEGSRMRLTIYLKQVPHFFPLECQVGMAFQSRPESGKESRT